MFRTGSRNVQISELPELAQAWGNVSAIVIHEPRLSKKGVQLDNLRLVAPEMFENYPVPSRRTFSWKDQKALHYFDTQAFLKAAKVEVSDNFGAIPQQLGQGTGNVDVGT